MTKSFTVAVAAMFGALANASYYVALDIDMDGAFTETDYDFDACPMDYCPPSFWIEYYNLSWDILSVYDLLVGECRFNNGLAVLH